MSTLVSSYGLAEALRAEGFPLPEECAEVRVVMAADAPLALRYTVHLTTEQVGQLGRAIARLGQEPD